MDEQTVTLVESKWEEIVSALKYRGGSALARAADPELATVKQRDLRAYRKHLLALALEIDAQRSAPVASRKAPA